MKDNKITDLITNPLCPTIEKWTNEVKYILIDNNKFTVEAKRALKCTKFYRGIEPRYTKQLIDILSLIEKTV